MNNSTSMDPAMDQEIISKAEVFFTLFIYVLTFILGVVGNVLVFLVVFSKKERKTANDIFLVNLAGADLLSVSVSLPLKFLLVVAPLIPLNYLVCKVLYPLMTLPYCAGIFTITSMALQRRNAILNPWKGMMTQARTFIWAGTIWVTSVLLTMPLSIFSSFDNQYCSFTWTQQQQKAYVLSIFVFQYILPLGIIIIAYVQICLNLSKYQKNIVRQEVRQENLEITRTIAVIVFLFAVFTLPLQVFWLLYVFPFNDIGFHSLQKLHHYAELLTDFHSCMNPLVYGALTRRFRRKYTIFLSSVFRRFERRASQREFRSAEPIINRNDEEIQLKQRRLRSKTM